MKRYIAVALLFFMLILQLPICVSAVAYLAKQGIEKERMTPVGYGEDKPKVVSKKMTEKYTFLKEGDVLSEEFINAIDNEEQREICHQINRRTEFRVLRTTYKLYE